MTPDEIVTTLRREVNQVKVRELKPEEFWGGSVSVLNLTEAEFFQKISEAANELGFTYCGYRTRNGDGFVYHISRYPRRAFGPMSTIEEHRKALQVLAEKSGTIGKEEERSGQPKFRVILGLQEGYDEHEKRIFIESVKKGEITNIEDAKKIIKTRIKNLYKFSIDIDQYHDLVHLVDALEKINMGQDHTLEEVKSELGGDFSLALTEICTVGPWGKYVEPAIIIEGNKSQKNKVYSLAEKFCQARIAVEDLQSGLSYMVETKYCDDPDRE